MNPIITDLVTKLVPVFLVLLIVFVVVLRHRSARDLQSVGILWLQAMRGLMTHIQRHRGLSAGVVSGDSQLVSAQQRVQKQVSRDFVQIAEVGDWIKNHSEWQNITQHWARLVGSLSRLPVVGCMEQHNRLIKNILALIDDVAEQHYLNGYARGRSVQWRNLLAIAELVGQARAIGVVIVTRSKLGSDEDSVAMGKQLQLVTQDIFTSLDSSHVRTALQPLALQTILDFMVRVDDCLVRDDWAMSGVEYYDEATRAIDLIYEQFDEELRSVNRRFQGAKS